MSAETTDISVDRPVGLAYTPDMDELVPLSDAKVHLHELVRGLAGRDVVLVRHGRPVGALLGYERYRDLIARADRGPDPRGSIDPIADAGQRLADACEARGVSRLAVFGSAARGDLQPDSDVDLLVRFVPMSPSRRSDALFGLHADLERVLGRSVDLIEDDAVRNPYVRATIDRDQRVVYERA